MELLVKMDILYEDKDKIILNMPVAGDGKKVWWKYFCIYVSNELISALAREFGHCVMIYFYLSLSFISISLVSVDS